MSHALTHLILTLPSKICGIVMPTAKMKKLALKGKMTYSRSHSWEVEELESKSKRSGSRVYTLNHNTILMRNWLRLGIVPRKKSNHTVLEPERTLKIIWSNLLILPMRKGRQSRACLTDLPKVTWFASSLRLHYSPGPPSTLVTHLFYSTTLCSPRYTHMAKQESNSVKLPFVGLYLSY